MDGVRTLGIKQMKRAKFFTVFLHRDGSAIIAHRYSRPELAVRSSGLGIQAGYTMLDSEQELPVTDAEGNIVEFDILPSFL